MEAPLSDQELAEMWDFHCELIQHHVLNYAPGGALWVRFHGEVANTPAGQLLRIAEDLNREPQLLNLPDRMSLLVRLGSAFAQAIKENDETLFHQLALVASARRENRHLSELSARALGINRTPGRPTKPYNLENAVFLALIEVTNRRTKAPNQDWEFTRDRITRKELRLAIQHHQKAAGLASAELIGSSEPSRWIKRTGIKRFMTRRG